jgi:hypothetical protein
MHIAGFEIGLAFLFGSDTIGKLRVEVTIINQKESWK